MPRTCHFDPDKGAILVSASGIFTDEEFWLGTKMTVSDPKFHANARVLVDFSQVTELLVSAERSIISSRRSFFPANRGAPSS